MNPFWSSINACSSIIICQMYKTTEKPATFLPSLRLIIKTKTIRKNICTQYLNQNIMKTSIKTLIASSLTAIVLSTSIFAANAWAFEKTMTKESPAKNFKRVSVKGNVEVTLVQRSYEGVSYADDNIGTAKIVQDGDALKINAADNTPVKLIVYVNDLFRIQATDNAVVKTEGKLTTKFLQIFLSGNARADIYTSTESLYTVIKDLADLKLSGSTDSHTLVMTKTPKLTIDRFAALKTNISAIDTFAVGTEVAMY